MYYKKYNWVSKMNVNPMIYSRYRKRKPFVKGKNTTIKRIASLERKVGTIRSEIELKFVDTINDDAVVDVGGTFQTTLNVITQDNTESGRTGRTVRLKSLWGHVTLILSSTINQADSPGGDVVRIVIVIDSQTNGVNPAVLNLFDTALYDAHYNITNEKRFTILYDKYFSINPRVTSTDGTNTVSTPEVVYHFDIKLSLRNTKIQYATSSGAISSQTKNSLHVMFISRSGLTAIESHWRVRFTDA